MCWRFSCVNFLLLAALVIENWIHVLTCGKFLDAIVLRKEKFSQAAKHVPIVTFADRYASCKRGCTFALSIQHDAIRAMSDDVLLRMCCAQVYRRKLLWCRKHGFISNWHLCGCEALFHVPSSCLWGAIKNMFHVFTQHWLCSIHVCRLWTLTVHLRYLPESEHSCWKQCSQQRSCWRLKKNLASQRWH